MKKVLVAFSGGLDTSFTVVHLEQEGYEVHTVSVNTGGWDKAAMNELTKKALSLGSVSHHNVDARREIYTGIIEPQIKLNGLYQGEYPLMCADRYLIVEKALEVARRLGISAVSHGCTAQGNDQVRFDAAFAALAPEVEVLTPVRDMEPSRKEEEAFLENNDFHVDDSVKRYSINENVFGVTVSGSEIDSLLEPRKQAYRLTSSEPPSGSTQVSIGFENGLPMSLDREELDGMAILERLNVLGGRYGYGRRIYTGDCILGIKGHLMFEAPGLLALMEAHRKLEQITLTKRQLEMAHTASRSWSSLVYDGLYYEPLVKDLQALADSIQARVNGNVVLKFEANRATVIELSSPDSLVNDDIAIYAQSASWSPDEVKGFIRFHTLQQTLG